MHGNLGIVGECLLIGNSNERYAYGLSESKGLWSASSRQNCHDGGFVCVD